MLARKAQLEAPLAEPDAPKASADPARAAAVVPLVPSRDQMHPGVYKLALACWAMLLVEFWITFFVSSEAAFMVAIVTFYALIYFGVPFLMSRMAGAKNASLFSLKDFARGRFETIDGSITGLEALLQVIMVPLLLSIGGIAIGLLIHSARIAN